MNSRALLGAFLLLSTTIAADAQQKDKPKWDPSPHIAKTEPLSPQEQLKMMKVPPGFEIQLVAADPDIRKPINIAFDAAGRLWVTETIEYPFPAKPGEERDSVKILEDFGPDGRARKISTFVDKLNIPIGVMPTSKGALVYSIPNISHMIDSKGVGKADVREIYYSGFGFDDTHGMTGEFQQGFDGWIYACHGYRNVSNVKSKNGETAISMTSGNTYRIKADGSRIEHFTMGQVNPFGLTLDPYGNLYSGDCHSRPLTMLLRGAWYESFAKAHDGLGFAPHMNTFKDHSTALCGVTYYAADQFPPEYRGKLFLGDVVMNRMNAYRLDWKGTSPTAVMEDFITSKDPWFRPVDIKLGPDGCLYVADFYNRVIGHYELPLTHPARDREKGRIWRIVYRGNDGKGAPQPVTNLATATIGELIKALAHTNLSVRLHAADQLVERGNDDAIQTLTMMLKNVDNPGNAEQRAHAFWVLERLGVLDDAMLGLAANSKEKVERVHAMRILTEKKTWTKGYASLAQAGLLDSDPFVQRAAVEALAAHPDASQIPAIIAMRHRVPASDNHLTFAVRLALREQLKAKDAFQMVAGKKWSAADHRAIADVCLSIKTEPSAEYVRSQLLGAAENAERARQLIHHVVRYGSPESTKWAVDLAAREYGKAMNAHALALKTIVQANQERGTNLSGTVRAQIETSVQNFLATANSDKSIAVELAGALRLAKAQPELLTLVKNQTTPAALRKSCVDSLINIDAKQSVPPLAEILVNEKEPIAVREQIANSLASTNHADAHSALIQGLLNAPARLQSTIALGMAGSAQGGDRLLKAIEAGKASPRLLQDRAIEVRLSTAKIANVKARLKKLTEGLPAADQKTQEMISKKRDAFVSFKADPAMGQKIFQKSCANCHQIATQGAKIGPQLDGIGVRGLERLLEDVLDPNRNVDQSFRTTQIVTKQGKTHTGLFLREEGDLVILGNNEGKEVRIEKVGIDERSVLPLSPMPSNFAETIGEADFHHLMAYLLTQRGKS